MMTVATVDSGTLLLTTKLTAPPPWQDLVARPRLLERLTAGLDRKLTLVSAPAGFGKTTLLAEWVAGCERPVAWLSVDAGDNDPVRFLAYLSAAVDTIDPDASRGVSTLAAPGTATAEQLTGLLNRLDRMGPVVLAFDDYHLVTAGGVHEVLAFLLEHLPASAHVAIATRADPPLPLSRLRARGQLDEIRAGDLQFTPEEAHAFLSRTIGLPLDARASAILQMRTEGWIAGLQLAGVSLQGRENVEGFVNDFAGSNRYILDYLIEEVLSRQPDEVQSFLLRTSILSRLTAPLCDAVVGTHDEGGTQTTLTSLEAANLFTIPLDDERRWFRYHHLFADCLRSRLGHAFPALVPELHQRAADWYEENGFWPEAIDHALQSGDGEHAARLLEKTALDQLARSEFITVRSWLEALPAEIIERHPALSVFYGWILLDSFHPAATDWLDRTDDADLPSHLRFLRAALLARLHWLHGQPGACTFALETGSTRDPFEDAGLSDPRAQAYLTVYAGAQLAEALRLQGRLRQAVETYRDALRRVEKIEPDGRLLAALSFAEMGLGRLLYEWNDLPAADQHMTRAIELARQGGNEQYESWVSMFLPPVRRAQGRSAEALALIDRAEASARRRGLGLEILWCRAQRTRLARIQGNMDALAGWLREQQPGADPETAGTKLLGYFEEFADATSVRALISLGRMDEAACLIDRLLEQTGASGQTGHTIEVLTLAAEAWEVRGDRTSALTELERALTLAEPEGYVRLFVDEGKPIADLLIAGRRQFSRVSPTYIEKLLTAFGHEMRETTTDVSQPLVEPLTVRELEVLHLLAAGLPNREIADQLIVTVGTVKRHTGNIYGKLGVDNRTQAILRAQSLGLL